MNLKQTPLHLDGITESLYAGFWLRLGSLLLDFLLALPLMALSFYLNSLGKYFYFFTTIPDLAFNLRYNIYLPKTTGGTPGKNILGIKIIRLDGDPIGWREAIIRYSFSLILIFLSIIVNTSCFLQADEEIYLSLSWMQQTQYLNTFFPMFFKIYWWMAIFWIFSGYFILMTNQRKRAIHDFIAGTVIVKTIYAERMRRAVSSIAPDA